MKTKLFLGAALVTVVLLGGSYVSYAQNTTTQPLPNNNQRAFMMQDPALLQQLTTFFQNKDYEGWKTFLESDGKVHPMLQVITKENFSKYADMKLHMIEAQKLREELGIVGKGMGNRKGGMMRQKGQHRMAPSTQQ